MRIFSSSCGDTVSWAGVLTEWSYHNDTSGACSVASGVAGATGNCFLIGDGLFSYNDTYLRKNLPTSKTRLIVGFRLEPINSLLSSGYHSIFSLWDNAGVFQIGLYRDASGRLSFWRDYPASSLQVGTYTANNTVQANTMVHIGMDIILDNAGAGSIVLYVNSLPIKTIPTVTTANNANGGAMVSIHSGQGLQGSAEHIGNYFDDFYVNDETGSDNNSISDLQCLALFPSAPGRLTQQTLGGSAPAATNWQSVKEHIPDDDVTYVSAATAGLVDLYKVDALPANVITVVCVETILDAKTDISGLGAGSTIRPKIGDGATESDGTSVPVNTSYIDKYESWGGTNPITALPWAVADFATIELGHERVV